MKKRTLGYIVMNGSAPMGLFKYGDAGEPRGGHLLFGGAATLFLTRAKAKGAIGRTIRYGAERGLLWSPDEQRAFRIVRVEAPRG